jgi:DNA mismatch repair protein MutL
MIPESLRIHLLPPLVAEQIAAGEVIERPASVVKELVENSIDAGATQIRINLSEGGLASIEVVDNGRGMAPADLEICLLRHATSKISSIQDLDTLGTLGFRGEALPSIASVAKLSITSRTEDSPSAFLIEAAHQAPSRSTPQETQIGLFLGSTFGTRVVVEGLFSHLPARLKFMKSVQSETSAAKEVIERLALAKPAIGFQLYAGSKEIISYESSNQKARIDQLLGAEEGLNSIHRSISVGGIDAEVYWVRGASVPHTRKLIQIVNGRVIKDRLLQQALLNPLRQSFLPGQFPALVAKFTFPSGSIDVNAHPTKSEIRFREPSILYRLASELLLPLTNPLAPPTAVDAEHPNQRSYFGGHSTTPAFEFSAAPMHPTDQISAPLPVEQPRYLATLYETFWLFQDAGRYILVDQHAAHERVRFERLKKRALKRSQNSSQRLLEPMLIRFKDEEQSEAVSHKLEWLRDLGFDVDAIGDTTFAFRSIPTAWGEKGLSIRLSNLLEKLAATDTPAEVSWDEAMFESIAMESCRGSIKAHDSVSPVEASWILDELRNCESPGSCPHGRPTTYEITEGRLEQWFQRRAP